MTEDDRLTAAGDDIQDILRKYECLMTVPELLIVDGELFPVIKLIPNPRPTPVPTDGQPDPNRSNPTSTP